VPVDPIKHTWSVDAYLCSFLTSALGRSEWSNLLYGPVTSPQGRTPKATK